MGVWTAFCIYKYRAKYKPIYVLSAVLLGVSVFDLIFRLKSFSSALVSFPNLLIWLAGILCGYIFAIIPQKKYRVGFVAAALLAGTWLSVPGYYMFLHYLSFGSMQGNTYERILCPLYIQNSEGETVEAKDLFNGYLVLDFWNSTCGVCFRDFPKVQELYDKIENNSQIAFYSVHCRRSDKGETFETGQHILRDRNYSFPAVSIDLKDQALATWGIKCYPTVLIIDSNCNIVYRGNIYRVFNKIEKLTSAKNR